MHSTSTPKTHLTTSQIQSCPSTRWRLSSICKPSLPYSNKAEFNVSLERRGICCCCFDPRSKNIPVIDLTENQEKSEALTHVSTTSRPRSPLFQASQLPLNSSEKETFKYTELYIDLFTLSTIATYSSFCPGIIFNPKENLFKKKKLIVLRHDSFLGDSCKNIICKKDHEHEFYFKSYENGQDGLVTSLTPSLDL